MEQTSHPEDEDGTIIEREYSENPPAIEIDVIIWRSFGIKENAGNKESGKNEEEYDAPTQRSYKVIIYWSPPLKWRRNLRHTVSH
jgi:hypothetical protein